MVSMRAKLTIESVTLRAFGETIKFNAIYGKPEDNSFAEATPSASAEFQINNKNLLGKFKPGQKFFVDFVPIAE